ncbi:MAG: hypothetical protein K8J08_13505, partial [Thermoanaerobaculia bacterium]|nr:hypothetical protein [Thermoanaerobaculia bacterium]
MSNLERQPDKVRLGSELPPTVTSLRPGQTHGILRFVMAPLAVLLQLLLADVAIEAFVRESPVRWSVAGGAAVILILGFLLWRRTSWTTRAAIPTLGLLGLFAFAAWRAGEVSDGLSLLGQSSPTPTAVVTALVVLLAGLSLLRIGVLRWWAKVVIAVLTVYGTSAFLLPLFTDLAHPSLLRGGGFWHRLPFWLEGGFVGALLLIPASILVLLAAGTRSVGSAQRWRWGFETTALGLALVLAVQTFTLPLVSLPNDLVTPPATGRDGYPLANTPLPESEGSAASSPESGIDAQTRRDRSLRPKGPRLELPPDPPSSLTAEEARPALDNLLAEVRTQRKGIERERFDLDTVLASTGVNVDAIFRWARANTSPLPYRGVLKGPQGTLMDRAGNSLDRSLLLAELLTRAGYRVELANAPLTEAGRKAVEARFLQEIAAAQEKASVASPTRTESAAVEASAVENIAAITKQDPSKMLRWVREVEQRGATLREEVLAQTDRQTAALIATATLERGGTSALESALPTLGDHWWVVLTEASPSRALDLSFDQGEASLTERGLAGPTRIYPVEGLPASLYHTVTLSVIADQWTGTAVTSRPALSETFRVADLQLQPIELAFAPSGGPQTLDELVGSESGIQPTEQQVRERVLAGLEEQTAWTPLMRVGNELFTQSTIAADGSLSPAAGVLGAGQALGRALSVFETFGESTGSATDHQLVGVTLEVEIRAPELSRSHPRSLVDLRSVADRLMTDTALRRQRAAGFLSRQTFVVQTGVVPSTYLADRDMERLLGLQGRLDGLAEAIEERDMERFTEELEPIRAPGASSLALAMLRLGEIAPSGAVALVHANVLSSFEEISLGDKADRLRLGLDIIDNEVLPLNFGADAARRRSVQQGVLDTLLEDALLNSGLERINTAKQFGEDLSVEGDLAAWRSESLIVAAGSHPEVSPALAFGADDAAVQIVYSPDRLADDPLSSTFWRVDQNTGETLGYSRLGRGVTMTETVIIWVNHVLTFLNFLRTAWVCGDAATGSDHCAPAKCVVRLFFALLGLGIPALGLGGSGSAQAGLAWKAWALVIGTAITTPVPKPPSAGSPP